MSGFDKQAPTRSISLKKFPSPWLTEDIRAKMTERNRARRKWRRQGSNDDYIRFKQLRNKIQNFVRVAKSNFYQETFWTLKESNSIWRKLKYLGLIKSKSLEPKSEESAFFNGITERIFCQ